MYKPSVTFYFTFPYLLCINFILFPQVVPPAGPHLSTLADVTNCWQARCPGLLPGVSALSTRETSPLSRTRSPTTSSAHCPHLAPGWEAVLLTVREGGPGQMELRGDTPTGPRVMVNPTTRLATRITWFWSSRVVCGMTMVNQNSLYANMNQVKLYFSSTFSWSFVSSFSSHSGVRRPGAWQWIRKQSWNRLPLQRLGSTPPPPRHQSQISWHASQWISHYGQEYYLWWG